MILLSFRVDLVTVASQLVRDFCQPPLQRLVVEGSPLQCSATFALFGDQLIDTFGVFDPAPASVAGHYTLITRELARLDAQPFLLNHKGRVTGPRLRKHSHTTHQRPRQDSNLRLPV